MDITGIFEPSEVTKDFQISLISPTIMEVTIILSLLPVKAKKGTIDFQLELTTLSKDRKKTSQYGMSGASFIYVPQKKKIHYISS